MTVNILAVGDVVGQTGLNILKERLKPLQTKNHCRSGERIYGKKRVMKGD